MILELFLTILSILVFGILVVAINGAILLTPVCMFVWGRNNDALLITITGLITWFIIWGIYLATLLDWILEL